MKDITKIDVYGILYLKPRDKAVMLKVFLSEKVI